MNLLKETIEKLASNGHTLDDIVSVQGRNVRISVDRFKALANREYDPGFGAQEVCSDLILLMKDGSWYDRDEYDGSEWWELRRRPEPLPEVGDDKVDTLFNGTFFLRWLGDKPEDDEDDGK